MGQLAEGSPAVRLGHRKGGWVPCQTGLVLDAARGLLGA